MLIARSDGPGVKFYSVSRAVMEDRKRYYSLLETLGHSDGDITEWVEWFVGRIDAGLTLAEHAMDVTLTKSRFWNEHDEEGLNERQRKMLNLLFDGFEGKLTSGKWAKICKVSADTALIRSERYPDVKWGIKMADANIGFADNKLTLPWFCAFLLDRYLGQDRDAANAVAWFEPGQLPKNKPRKRPLNASYTY